MHTYCVIGFQVCSYEESDPLTMVIYTKIMRTGSLKEYVHDVVQILYFIFFWFTVLLSCVSNDKIGVSFLVLYARYKAHNSLLCKQWSYHVFVYIAIS